MLAILWLIAAVMAAVFAVWGRAVGSAMSRRELTGNERRFAILRGMAAFCAVGFFVEAIAQWVRHR